MKKSDFRKHKLEYIDSCKVIVRDEGRCTRGRQDIECDNCPFDYSNNKGQSGCTNNSKYKNLRKPSTDKDPILLNAAKEYLRLYTGKSETEVGIEIEEDDSLIYDRNIIVVE